MDLWFYGIWFKLEEDLYLFRTKPEGCAGLREKLSFEKKKHKIPLQKPLLNVLSCDLKGGFLAQQSLQELSIFVTWWGKMH